MAVGPQIYDGPSPDARRDVSWVPKANQAGREYRVCFRVNSKSEPRCGTPVRCFTLAVQLPHPQFDDDVTPAEVEYLVHVI